MINWTIKTNFEDKKDTNKYLQNEFLGAQEGQGKGINGIKVIKGIKGIDEANNVLLEAKNVWFDNFIMLVDDQPLACANYNSRCSDIRWFRQHKSLSLE